MTRRGFFKLLPLALAALPTAIKAAQESDLQRLRREVRNLLARERDPYKRLFPTEAEAKYFALFKLGGLKGVIVKELPWCRLWRIVR